MFRKRDTHIHFVGIGGIGMSGIAEVLLNLGYRVSGSDVAANETTRRLAGLGAEIRQGHHADAVAGADVVVTSSAVGSDNPEVVAARARKTPVIPRAEMLAELMRLKQGLLVAGSHGKTTTTSLIATVLHEAGLDPTVVIGGKLNAIDSNARLGQGEVLVAEADESDGSFLLLTPTLAVITNIDTEHLDHYGTLGTLKDAFVGFANRVPFYGMCVVCVDDPNVRSILDRLTKRTVRYSLDGADNDVDYLATNVRVAGGRTRFAVRAHGRDLGDFELAIPGAHNVRNALATIAVCDEQQVHPDVTRAALASFRGVQRRFSLRGERGGISVYDDYGHHPTELAATLQAARSAWPERRLVAVVQPHRYSRVRDTLAGFAHALRDADVVIVTEIYAAGEAPLPGIDGATLARTIAEGRAPGCVIFEPALDRVAAAVCGLWRPGDTVVTLGAGSITRVSHELAAALP